MTAFDDHPSYSDDKDKNGHADTEPIENDPLIDTTTDNYTPKKENSKNGVTTIVENGVDKENKPLSEKVRINGEAKDEDESEKESNTLLELVDSDKDIWTAPDGGWGWAIVIGGVIAHVYVGMLYVHCMCLYFSLFLSTFV